MWIQYLVTGTKMWNVQFTWCVTSHAFFTRCKFWSSSAESQTNSHLCWIIPIPIIVLYQCEYYQCVLYKDVYTYKVYLLYMHSGILLCKHFRIKAMHRIIFERPSSQQWQPYQTAFYMLNSLINKLSSQSRPDFTVCQVRFHCACHWDYTGTILTIYVVLSSCAVNNLPLDIFIWILIGLQKAGSLSNE